MKTNEDEMEDKGNLHFLKDSSKTMSASFLKPHG